MAPSPDSIKESVEKIEKFVDWLADVLSEKNLVRKLLLIDVLLFAIFNPLYFPAFFERVTGKTLVWHPWVFWPTIGCVFIGAVITARRIRKEQVFDVKWDERSAIKGLLPFGFLDAELFRRLEREENIRECLPVLADSLFRFGILCGESGCGKPSFLEAGLRPRLLEKGHRCLYVKFTDLDPLDSICLALVEQFKLSKEAVENADFLALLDATLQSDNRPAILLFDQFEQFFVHRTRAKQRKPFVEALAAWYRQTTAAACQDFDLLARRLCRQIDPTAKGNGLFAWAAAKFPA